MVSTTGQNCAPNSSVCGGREIPERILFGHSRRMMDVRAQIEKAAQTNVPVLIVGEVGTGKEVIARHIHSQSQRRSGSFVRINCPGIPGALLESELFGYERGSFTGAFEAKAGLVESASGGSLFLDSIGELEFELQPKFLQFLQDGQFTRIGGQETLRSDVRILSAASRRLEAEVELGHFREDLLYRINVITIELPPLRDRRRDIPQLVDFFLVVFSKEFRRTPRPIRASTRNLLVASDWPGNIRQLENVIKRYVIFDNEESIHANVCGLAPLALNTPTGTMQPMSLKQVTQRAKKEIERNVILETLSANHWNRKRTAEALNVSYRALLYKMKESGLSARSIHSANMPEEHE